MIPIYEQILIEVLEQEGTITCSEDRVDILKLAKELELTGDFKTDLDILKEAWLAEEETLEKDPTEEIEKVVRGLKVGFNYVPGIGVGYCSSKEDLEAMRNFVRGGMTIQSAIKGMFGL